MMNEAIIQLAAGLLAVLMLIIAPLCWFTVRLGSTRSAANSERLANRMTGSAGSVLWLGGLIAAGGAIVAVVSTVEGDPAEGATGSAVIAGGLLLLLVGFLTRICAQKIRRLVDDNDDDLQMDIDRRLGTLAFIGWAAFIFAGALLLPISPLVGGLFLLVLFIVLPMTAQIRRARRQCQLLWMLTISVRSGRNLPVELRNLASCFYGSYAACVRQLAQDVESGLPLGDALLVARENSLSSSPAAWLIFLAYNPVSLAGRYLFGSNLILPAWIIAAIQIAGKTGTLEKTLAATSKQYLDSIRTRFTLSNISGLAAYVLAYVSVGGAIFSFLMYWIIPKMKAIFEGFGTEFPTITVRMLEFSDFVMEYWYLFVLLGLYPLRLLARMGVGEPLAWKNLNSIFLGRCFARLDAPDVLRQLGAVIRSGKPLTVALDALARSHQRNSARLRLEAVHSGVETGGDCWELLAAQGYLRSQDLQLIRVAGQAGNLPWALEELAASRERALEHRMQFAVSFVEPAVILAFGVFCAFIIIGFFMPMIKLVNDLS